MFFIDFRVLCFGCVFFFNPYEQSLVLLTGCTGQLSHVVSCPGHLVLCDRMCYDGSWWAARWLSVLSTIKMRTLHFGGGLPFEVKVFLPPARQQRQFLSLLPFERVLWKQLEVSTRNFQILESRNYSSLDCSGDFYSSCLMVILKESKSALFRNVWQQRGLQWGREWETNRGHYAGRGAESRGWNSPSLVSALLLSCYLFFHPYLLNKGVH